jgi:formylglycine-generating enzyme required for sulfatase activity
MLSTVHALVLLAAAWPPGPPDMVRVPSGTFRPVYPPSPKEAEVQVPAFWLDRRPVTNAEFLAFVEHSPRWKRGVASPLFADRGYLSHWLSADEIGPEIRPGQPVTRVSWFAAKAYCEARNARLPYEQEWERAAAADETSADARSKPEFIEKILGWYSRPTGTLAEVGRSSPNHFGLMDLHGLVWEWVLDFASAMATGDNRGSADASRFCGGAGLTAGAKDDYAAFMRIAFRSSLKGAYTTANLGFRCAMDDPGPTKKGGRKRE